VASLLSPTTNHPTSLLSRLGLDRCYSSSADVPFPPLELSDNTADAALTFPRLGLVTGQPILETLVHPLDRPVRLDLRRTPAARLELTLVRLVNLLLLLLVDDPVVGKVRLLRSDLGLALDVVAERDESANSSCWCILPSRNRGLATHYASKACRLDWLKRSFCIKSVTFPLTGSTSRLWLA
jgi:hypothetical protein